MTPTEPPPIKMTLASTGKNKKCIKYLSFYDGKGFTIILYDMLGDEPVFSYGVKPCFLATTRRKTDSFSAHPSC
jgi:hypothetical protein